jgi:prepilin-type processing-associated H-X9-DG protein
MPGGFRLVVIAIIAILAAILFPVFAQAREQARLAACQSNCKQYSTAWMMYVQDYDSTFPCFSVAAAFKPGELNATTWDLLLQPYIKNYGMARCPSDPYPAFYEFADGSTIWRSYGVPRNMIWNPGKGLPFPRTEANVPQPADTLLMFEKNQGAGVNGWPYPKTRTPKSSWDVGAAGENWQHMAWERHGDRMVALFADGHVKTLKGRRQGKYRFPPSDDTTSAAAIAVAFTTVAQPPTAASRTAPPTPRPTPISPPSKAMMADSIRNCRRMSRGVAPIALRMPISRVRSVTETSMMFMIPIPPTTSEMTATALNSDVMVLVTLC